MAVVVVVVVLILVAILVSFIASKAVTHCFSLSLKSCCTSIPGWPASVTLAGGGAGLLPLL